MATRRNPLRGESWLYDLTEAPQHFTPKEARAEYARLRAIAVKRLQRLEAARPESKIVSKFKGQFQPLTRGASERTVYKALQDVARFASAKSYSISGLKESERKAAETLREHGYDIDKKDIKEFGEFMGAVKTGGQNKGYDSERLVEFFKKAKDKKLDPVSLGKHFNFWMEKNRIDRIPEQRFVTSHEHAQGLVE